jgi:methylated-DNA-[protein]-cysteine S-methyltransferase
MDKIYYTLFETPFCEIFLVGNEEGLSHLHLNTQDGKRQFKISAHWKRQDRFFIEAQRQIDAYFAGELTHFDLVLNLEQGTPFQQKVWQTLRSIPFGSLRTYQQIAEAVGHKKAARAIGMANSQNPIPLIVPCHRVIASNGQLGGFASGLKIKEKLIQFETSLL